MFLTPEILTYAHGGDKVIASYKDKRWKWCGFIKSPLPYVGMVCPCSNRATVEEYIAPPMPVSKTFNTIILNRYHFVESDMLLITVYIGKCEKCDGVYWYQSAPPYKRIEFQSNINVV